MLKRFMRAALVACAIACPAPSDAQLAIINGCAAASLSVTTSSSNVHLGLCGPLALVMNVGAAEAFYVLGGTSATTAVAATSYSIPPASSQLVKVGADGEWIAAITGTGTTTIRITQILQQ